MTPKNEVQEQERPPVAPTPKCPLGNHLVFVWPNSGKIVPHFGEDGKKCPASYAVHPNVTTEPEPSSPSVAQERANTEHALAREVIDKTSKIQLLEEQLGKLEQQLAEARVQGMREAAEIARTFPATTLAGNWRHPQRIRESIAAAIERASLSAETEPEEVYESEPSRLSDSMRKKMGLRPRAGRDLEVPSRD